MWITSIVFDYVNTNQVLRGYFIFYEDLSQLGGIHFFNLVKEGDSMIFATDDENERLLWVQSIYRATGQTHKPTAPAKNPACVANATTTASNASQSASSATSASGIFTKGGKGGK